jgi:hypothetical protein
MRRVAVGHYGPSGKPGRSGMENGHGKTRKGMEKMKSGGGFSGD